MAGFQEKGHGQYQREWQSLPGRNLLMSTIIYPAFLRANEGFLLNIMMSLSMLDLLKHWKIHHVELKWPNDVLVHGKKISGLLVQTGIMGQNIQYAVTSVGLNVNQTQWSKNMKPQSLKQLLGTSVSIQDVFERLCVCCEHLYDQIKDHSKHSLFLKRYQENLKGIGMPVVIHQGFRSIEGTLKAVDVDGAIILTSKSGDEKIYQGQLEFVN
jgi:BirA family biotin operon repressor/biotin-[acetyl-CoA-carboxylase] ligase